MPHRGPGKTGQKYGRRSVTEALGPSCPGPGSTPGAALTAAKEQNVNNFIQPGETLPLTVDRNVSSGGGFLKGAIFGVATGDILDTEEGEFNTCGVYELAKTSAQAWAVGDKLY